MHASSHGASPLVDRSSNTTCIIKSHVSTPRPGSCGTTAPVVIYLSLATLTGTDGSRQAKAAADHVTPHVQTAGTISAAKTCAHTPVNVRVIVSLSTGRLQIQSGHHVDL